MDLIWQGNRLSRNGYHLITNPSTDNSTLKMEILTTNSNQSVTIPHQAGFTHNYTIDYGDGSSLGMSNPINIHRCSVVITFPKSFRKFFQYRQTI
jgi:hypothetical protein